MRLDDGLASENLGLVIRVTDVQQPRNQHSGGGGAQALQVAGMEPRLVEGERGDHQLTHQLRMPDGDLQGDSRAHAVAEEVGLLYTELP